MSSQAALSDPPILKQGSDYWDLWASLIGNGMLSGMLSGAIVGSFVFPLAGTLVGGFLGGVAGIVGGILLGPVTAFVAKRSVTVEMGLRHVQTVTAAAASIVALAIFAFYVTHDEFSFTALACLFVFEASMCTAAAWSAADAFRRAMAEPIAGYIQEGWYGPTVKIWHMIIVSIATPLSMWVLAGLGQLAN